MRRHFGEVNLLILVGAIIFSGCAPAGTGSDVGAAAPTPREVDASARGGESLARDPDAATKLALLPLTPSERAAQRRRRAELRGEKGVEIPEEVAPRSADGLAAPETVAEAPTTATRSDTGLAFRILRPGTGDRPPDLDDEVDVHYVAWTRDGRLFDSSHLRGIGEVLRVRDAIPGWREALLTMVIGEKRRLWIPGALAYGGGDRVGGPEGMLVFDLELLDIRRSR